MEYRPLGRTGVQVSKLCLGTMMFGAWGNSYHDDSIRIIQAALDTGINFVDTADVYSAGESEEIVGKALTGRRDDVVSPPSSSCRWATIPTSAAARAAGSSRRSRTPCGVWGPTGSTSIRSTDRTPEPTLRKPSAR
jgi:Aldo/keto reductase family